MKLRSRSRLTVCATTSPTKANVVIVREQTTKQEFLECPECKRNFLAMKQLDYHMKVRHKMGVTASRSSNSNSTPPLPMDNQVHSDGSERDNNDENKSCSSLEKSNEAEISPPVNIVSLELHHHQPEFGLESPTLSSPLHSSSPLRPENPTSASFDLDHEPGSWSYMGNQVESDRNRNDTIFLDPTEESVALEPAGDNVNLEPAGDNVDLEPRDNLDLEPRDNLDLEPEEDNLQDLLAANNVNVEPQNSKSPPPLANPPKKIHRESLRPCPIEGCNALFPKKPKRAFNNHLQMHEGLKPNVCPFCKVGYETAVELLQHVACKHSSLDSAFKCDGCSKNYKTHHGLISHKICKNCKPI